MVFASENALVKGGAKMALGLFVAGTIMALDTAQVLPNDTYGKATKWAGFCAGTLYAVSGLSLVMTGRS